MEKTFDFCEESELTKDGLNTVYYTKEQNGDFVSGSLSYNREVAHSFFKLIIESGGTCKKITVLETGTHNLKKI